MSTSFLTQLVRTDRFLRGAPDRYTITEDGTTVLFLRGRGCDDPVACLWALDLDSGTERVLADPVALLDSEPTGIPGYATDSAGTLVAFVLAGGLWTVDVGTGRSSRVSTPDRPAEPRPDPTGTRIAYRAGDELRLIDRDGGSDRALCSPDGSNVSFGVARETFATSVDGTPSGFWWAPDGNRLLVARSDVTDVPLWYLSDPSKPTVPPRAMRYSAVGTPNPEVTLWLTALDGTRTPADWDRRAFEYVVGAGWDAHGPFAVVQSRDQHVVLFLAIDPATGRTSVLDEQRDERWVQLLPGLPARTADGALVTHADRGDTRHLAVAGTIVTPPGLQLRAVLDIAGDDVLFTASDEPTVTHLFRYTPAEGVTRLTDSAAVHSAVRRSGTMVRVGRGSDRPGGQVSVLRQGKPPVPVDSLVDRPVLDPNVRHLVLGPRALRAALYLPSWYTTDHGRLPIIVDPYGGAARQRVTAELDWRCLVPQWFAEHGFAVLVADGAGTPGRGPAWEREVYGHVFGPALDDQVTALQEVTARFPDLDAGRVGIRGWSFSGALAEYAVLTRPDVFHAAVAGAGVTDQTLYYAHTRERFLGQPDRFPEHYQRYSLVRLAPRLTRPLLLIHGLADDNVHPSNTILLSEALLAAGRPHELLLLPGIDHNLFGSPVVDQVLRRQLAFFQQHL